MAAVAENTAVAESPVAEPVEATEDQASGAPADGQQGAQTTAGFASASLYVGDLHPEVTEAQLFEVFSPYGSVASIRVCRDTITRRSLGYAYCNFHENDNAKRALAEVNGASIRGRPCRVMWSQRDPATRKSGKGNVFIKNLEKSITQKQLLETFQQFGKIISCKIETDDNKGESKGYGYIQFAEDDDAQAAIDGVNGMMLKDKIVFVGNFLGRKERVKDTGSARFTNVYIKNLPDGYDDVKLADMFEKFGETTSVLLVSAAEDIKHKGFGFVNFKEPEQAAAACAALNGTEIDGKTLYVGRAQKKADRQTELRQQFEQRRQERLSKYEGVNLYVKNLDDDVDDDKLREMFEAFGNITSTKVMKDQKNSSSRGFGFVCFATRDEATKAVTTMNGKLQGTKPLYVALAQPRELRRRQLEMQFAQRHMAAAAGVPVVPGMPAMAGRPMPGFPGPMPGMPAGFPPGRGGPGGPGFPGFNPQAAMFYGQPGQPMMFPNMPGGYKVGPGRGQPPANYVMMGNARGGRGGRGRGRGGHQGGAEQAAQPGAEAAAAAVAGGKLTAAMLQDFPKNEQNRLLGEHLYPMIHATHPELCGKITGMILESCDVEEMIQLIDDSSSLQAKVAEALEVLQEHKD